MDILKNVNHVEDQVELAILRIAFLISALDGRIEDAEYDFFGQLLAGAHIASGLDVLGIVEKTRQNAESLAQLARDRNSKAKVLQSFMSIVDSFCPWTDLVDLPIMARNAFAIWTAMAMSDGNYCDIERSAIQMLQRKINAVPRIGDEFLSDIEEKIADLASIKSMIEETSSSKARIKLRAKAQSIMAEMNVF